MLQNELHVSVARFTVPLRLMKLKTFLTEVNWNLYSHEVIKKFPVKPIGILSRKTQDLLTFD